MSKTEMLINYVPGEECRIAIVEDGSLEEFYQERASAGSLVGNIYKGKVTNVEPSIQAAFVDFGEGRNGFLHITDLHPSYFQGKHKEETEQVGSKTPRHERPPIQKCLKRGTEILVQVLKEGIGTKGPTLTSYLSIPGRFLVMMPQMQRLGVSRKVDDDDARRAMKKILADLKPPDGFGFIVRTAGIGQTKTDLKRDLAYLVRLWKSIERRKKQIKNVGELYTEQDLIIRTLRDVFTSDISRVVIDNPKAAQRANDFLAVASPRSRPKVVYYHDPVPLFHRFDIERQIESINAREVPLKSGGSLVFDQTEALVAIDVNSGKSRSARDAESNAFNTNMEAVDQICRQLRLRDLGGVVVNDLIDMTDMKRRRKVESRFRENLKKDRARTRVGSISQFGLLEMTRQRMRPSLASSLSSACVACDGRGSVKSPESVVLDVMRRLALVLHRGEVVRAELLISPDAAFHLLNRKRAQLVELENRYNKPVTVRIGGASVDHVDIRLFDERGGQMEFDTLSDLKGIASATDTTYVEVEDGELPEFEDLEPDDTVTAEDHAAAHASLGHADQSLMAEDDHTETETKPGKRKRRRRRRGRGRGSRNEENSEEQGSEAQSETGEAPAEDSTDGPEPGQAESEDGDAPAGKKKRRRRRGGRGRKKKTDAEASTGEGEATAEADNSADEATESKADEGSSHEPKPETGEQSDEEAAPPKKRSRRGRGRKKKAAAEQADGNAEAADDDAPKADADVDGNLADPAPEAQADGDEKPKKKPTRKRKRTTKKSKAAGEASSAEASGDDKPKDDGKPAGDGYSNQVVIVGESSPEPA